MSTLAQNQINSQDETTLRRILDSIKLWKKDVSSSRRERRDSAVKCFKECLREAKEDYEAFKQIHGKENTLKIIKKIFEDNIKLRHQDPIEFSLKRQEFVDGEWCPDFAIFNNEKFSIEDAEGETIEKSYIVLNFKEFVKYAHEYSYYFRYGDFNSLWNFLKDEQAHMINLACFDIATDQAVYGDINLIDKKLDSLIEDYHSFLEDWFDDDDVGFTGTCYDYRSSRW